MAVLIDSYSESNQDGGDNLTSVASVTMLGQTFVGDGSTLDSCKFYLKKTGSPTGNAVAKLYAHTGSYGDGEPTGAALATSGNLDVTTLTTSYVLTTLSFTGGNQVALSGGTPYCIVIEYSSGDGSNYVTVGYDGSSPSHAGNTVFTFTGSFGKNTGRDTCFYVYSVSGPPIGGYIHMSS